MSQANGFLRLFEGKNAAELYKKVRLSYPKFVSEDVLGYMSKQDKPWSSKLDRLLDVGCGSGQATHAFAPYFNSVLGIDISQGQIDVARETNKSPGVTFGVVHDNYFPVEDQSVDLVTCAAAVHWLHLDTFISECKRVLKPGGHVAVIGYRRTGIRREKSDEWNPFVLGYIMKFASDCKSNFGAFHQMDGYSILYNQINGISKTWLPTRHIETYVSLADFLLNFSSLSSYQLLSEQEKREKDPLKGLGIGVKKMLEMEKMQDDDVSFYLRTEFSIIMLKPYS